MDVTGRGGNDGIERDSVAFDEFARDVEARLWQALTPVFGPHRAALAVNDALVYAWSHWDRVTQLDNPPGYLYRLACRSASRADHRGQLSPAAFPIPTAYELPEFEPALVPALLALSPAQRSVVWLVEGCGWGLTDTARMLDVSVSTVRNHLARGMKHLRATMEVTTDA
jgi:DNA-directed RNA polymerase specialized sigma24 family protein